MTEAWDLFSSLAVKDSKIHVELGDNECQVCSEGFKIFRSYQACLLGLSLTTVRL
jgi:hypothetical protein